MPFIDVQGRRIHFADGGGQGTPLLLLHAFPLDGRMWDGAREALGDRFRVIGPDLSGFGRSDVPADPEGYSVDRWADEAAAVLDACGVDRAVVGGCSMGGYVSFAFLRRHGARATGLLLVDTRAEADDEATRAARAAQREEVRTGDRKALLERLREKLLAPASKARQPLVEHVASLMEQPDDGIVGALSALARRPDSSPDLPGIRVPTLVVVGELDALTPPAVAERMQRGIPGARLVVLPGIGHLANLEDPEGFHRAVATLAPGS